VASNDLSLLDGPVPNEHVNGTYQIKLLNKINNITFGSILKTIILSTYNQMDIIDLNQKWEIRCLMPLIVKLLLIDFHLVHQQVLFLAMDSLVV
jgi:hypothetical protein